MHSSNESDLGVPHDDVLAHLLPTHNPYLFDRTQRQRLLQPLTTHVSGQTYSHRSNSNYDLDLSTSITPYRNNVMGANLEYNISNPVYRTEQRRFHSGRPTNYSTEENQQHHDWDLDNAVENRFHHEHGELPGLSESTLQNQRGLNHQSQSGAVQGYDGLIPKPEPRESNVLGNIKLPFAYQDTCATTIPLKNFSWDDDTFQSIPTGFPPTVKSNDHVLTFHAYNPGLHNLDFETFPVIKEFNDLFQPNDRAYVHNIPGQGQERNLKEVAKTKTRRRRQDGYLSVRNRMLVELRSQGVHFKEIQSIMREQLGIDVQDSTLRGAHRTLTKPLEARQRKPQWSNEEDEALKEAVNHFVSLLPLRRISDYGQLIKKIPWKKCAEWMHKERHSKLFGNSTTKKRYLKLLYEGRAELPPIFS